MVTREETNKMRKELVRAERILAQKEKARESKPVLTPMQLKKEKDRPEPKTADVPNVIHNPKRKKLKKENIPFF
tara:strand:- start:59 stop:280 length:222 start_codon:yes stop_codon:yes gene_type:complete